jgi:septum formation protein
MSEKELETYLADGDWEGKAGAYGIQGEADRFIERCQGSYTNVVGLPVELVKRMLADFG